MVYLPKSVASCEQAAPKRKMATKWTSSEITEGIRIADEMLIVEALFWRVILLELELFLHRKISIIIICFEFFRKKMLKILLSSHIWLVADGLDRSI